jgi:lysozyme
VSAGQINTITQALTGIDTVTNVTGFLNGSDAESDAALRTRFIAYVASLSKATKNAIGYPDPADPTIATICYGETQGVMFGETKTPQECLQMLETRIPDFLAQVDRLLPNLPAGRRIAYTDAAYNMGAGILTRRTNGQAGTSIVDLERAGKFMDACRRLLVFDRAGGKELPGLVKRRQQEYSRCSGEPSS